MAQLGRIVGQFGDGGGQDRIEDADRNLSGWFRDAILEFVPLGEWDDVLLRACQGPGEQDRAWARQQFPPEPTHRLH